jgi:hypothetical protein
MGQLGSHWMDFHVIWYLKIFPKYLSKKYKFHSNLTRITGTLHEDHNTFLSYLTRLFLEWKMFHTKVVDEIKTPFSCSITFFENRAFYKTIWKNGVERSRPQLTIWRMPSHAGYLRLQTHTHNMQYLMFFHYKNCCMKPLQCYVIRTLTALLKIINLNKYSVYNKFLGCKF